MSEGRLTGITRTALILLHATSVADWLDCSMCLISIIWAIAGAKARSSADAVHSKKSHTLQPQYSAWVSIAHDVCTSYHRGPGTGY